MFSRAQFIYWKILTKTAVAVVFVYLTIFLGIDSLQNVLIVNLGDEKNKDAKLFKVYFQDALNECGQGFLKRMFIKGKKCIFFWRNMNFLKPLNSTFEGKYLIKEEKKTS